MRLSGFLAGDQGGGGGGEPIGGGTRYQALVHLYYDTPFIMVLSVTVCKTTCVVRLYEHTLVDIQFIRRNFLDCMYQ
jgi:hypothetical protein